MDVVGAAAARVREAVTFPVFERELPATLTQVPGGLALVVRDGGAWGSRNSSDGHAQKIVTCVLYADSTRDGTGLPTAQDAARRAWAAWSGIDLALHDTGRTWHAVALSVRQAAPSEFPLDDSDHACQLIGRFQVAL